MSLFEYKYPEKLLKMSFMVFLIGLAGFIFKYRVDILANSWFFPALFYFGIINIISGFFAKFVCENGCKSFVGIVLAISLFVSPIIARHYS